MIGEDVKKEEPTEPTPKNYLKIAGIVKDVSFWGGGFGYITPFQT